MSISRSDYRRQISRRTGHLSFWWDLLVASVVGATPWVARVVATGAPDLPELTDLSLGIGALLVMEVVRRTAGRPKAAYELYRDTALERDRLSLELTRLQSPVLEGAIEHIVVGEMNLYHGASARVVPASYYMLFVRVQNVGVPTSLSGFALTVHAGDGTLIPCEPIAWMDGAETQIGASRVPLAPGDQLENKTSTPIPTGGIVFGIITFVFPNRPSEAISASGVVLSLEMVDAWSERHVIEREFGKEGIVDLSKYINRLSSGGPVLPDDIAEQLRAPSSKVRDLRSAP